MQLDIRNVESSDLIFARKEIKKAFIPLSSDTSVDVEAAASFSIMLFFHLSSGIFSRSTWNGQPAGRVKNGSKLPPCKVKIFCNKKFFCHCISNYLFSN